MLASPRFSQRRFEVRRHFGPLFVFCGITGYTADRFSWSTVALRECKLAVGITHARTDASAVFTRR